MSDIAQLAGALAEQAHLEPALLSTRQLAPLLEERRRALRLKTDDEYAREALRDSAEFGRLRDLIAVPETWLFRYLASFELLRSTLQSRRPARVRALSVACATGAEPLAIAATALAAGVPGDAVTVVSVDSSADALARARTGGFSHMAVREGVPAWAQQWFTELPGGVQAKNAVLSRAEWVEGTAPGALGSMAAQGFDVIFCRNLAIYLGNGARKELGTQLARLLAPDGLLFLGHAEPTSLFGLEGVLTPLEPRGSFAFARAVVVESGAGASGAGASGADAGGAGANGAARRAPVAAAPRAQAAVVTQTPAWPAPVRAAASQPVEPPTLEAVRTAADGGRVQEALDLGRLRTAAGDRSCALLLLMGSAHAAIGEYAPAEEFLRQVVYLEPEHADALLQLASLAERRGDPAMSARYRARAAKCAAPQGGSA